MVRFPLDEYVPRGFERLLAERGHETDRAKDRFGERTVDPEPLVWSASHGVVSVANNARDFERLHEAHRHGGNLVCGERDLLVEDPAGVARVVDTGLSQYATGGITDELVELDEWYAWCHGY